MTFADLLTVADILRAIGMTENQIAGTPALRSLSGLNICARQRQDQPVKLVSKSIWGAKFPEFCAKIDKPAPRNADHCAPSVSVGFCSLPAPISLAPAMSNIKSAKGLINKTTETVTKADASAADVVAKPPLKVKSEKTKALAARAPQTKLGAGFDEAAPSFYDPPEGPFSMSTASKAIKLLHAEGQKIRAQIELLEYLYLEDLKKHVAVNNLPGKEKLAVPDSVHQKIVD